MVGLQHSLDVISSIEKPKGCSNCVYRHTSGAKACDGCAHKEMHKPSGLMLDVEEDNQDE